MTYRFGTTSRQELVGVHPLLVAVVERALVLSVVDFAVHDGKRTEEEQREYVRTGVSHTLDSRHLTGHAVDLVPYVNGKLRWEWPPIYRIADAMRAAARELKCPLVWGAAWDINFVDAVAEPQAISNAYVARQKAKGKRVFLDGPHYELPRNLYP